MAVHAGWSTVKRHRISIMTEGVKSGMAQCIASRCVDFRTEDMRTPLLLRLLSCHISTLEYLILEVLVHDTFDFSRAVSFIDENAERNLRRRESGKVGIKVKGQDSETFLGSGLCEIQCSKGFCETKDFLFAVMYVRHQIEKRRKSCHSA